MREAAGRRKWDPGTLVVSVLTSPSVYARVKLQKGLLCCVAADLKFLI